MAAPDSLKRLNLTDAFGNVLSFLILLLIGVLAFSIFLVIKYEYVIHEFDPYFNYRFTQVRLILVLAPAACIMSGIALPQAFNVFPRSIKFHLPGVSGDFKINVSILLCPNFPHSKIKAFEMTFLVIKAGDSSPDSVVEQNDTVKPEKCEDTIEERLSTKKKKKEKEPVAEPSILSKIEKRFVILPLESSVLAIFLLFWLGAFYVVHCVWATAEAYSVPSIVLTTHPQDGLHVSEDFREAYALLCHNTEVDDKVASWWDYGYQTTAMANRTVIVDDNTCNNTHIATVGTAMSSPGKAAWEIFNSFDVKYVVVVFGGLVGYPSDDINKFLWMVRIRGGVFPIGLYL